MLVDGSKDDLVLCREVIKDRSLRATAVSVISAADEAAYAIPDMLNASIGQMLSGDFARLLASDGARLALQLPFLTISESMGNHDSKIVDAGSVD
jgi:hypothetical protein